VIQLNLTKNNGYEFLDFIRIKEVDMHSYEPISGSFAVINCKGKYLMCYNTWRKQWEIPAGRREENETPKECAIRELYEETGQVVNDLTFKGLLKVKNSLNGQIKYNPVYFTTIEKLQPFLTNDETDAIKLWDLKEKIGYIDNVDFKLFKYV